MDARRQQGQRLDQWLETGRQLVDGVAGTRPGRRGGFRVGRSAPASLDAVGRWVGDKVDWLLDEEDDGRDSWRDDPGSLTVSRQRPQTSAGMSAGKRPLDAISRRQPALIPPASVDETAAADGDNWPEEDDFRVERWQRGTSAEPLVPSERLQARRPSGGSSPAPMRRALPRSSRRRDG